MSQEYRVVVQTKKEDGQFDEGSAIYTGQYNHPTTILELGLRHHEQIDILNNLLNPILKHQSTDLQENITFCPKCGTEVIRNGVTCSSFNTVFTDHKVAVHRLKCSKCNWSSVPSIKSLFGTNLHPDLIKLQCEQGAKTSFADAQATLNKLSSMKRTVNNQMSLRQVVETVGNHISEHPHINIPENITEEKEIIVQVDGGYVKSRSKDSRSFEALTSVVYKSESIIPGKKKRESGRLKQKYCAASALNDSGEHINALTLVAAKKEGLTHSSIVTALCDGADNCWNVMVLCKSEWVIKF